MKNLRLGLRHLRYHKSQYNFQDSLSPPLLLRFDTESTSHYLLHCPLFEHQRKTFLGNIKSINHKFLEQNDSTLTPPLVFGYPASSVETNTLMLNAAIQYLIKDSRKISCKENHDSQLQRLLPFIIYFHILFSF